MDVVFSRPHSFRLFEDWKVFKKESFERLRGSNDSYDCTLPRFFCNDPSPEPRPCGIDIEDCHRGLYPTQGLVNQLKQTPLWCLLSDLDNEIYELILWEERIAR